MKRLHSAAQGARRARTRRTAGSVYVAILGLSVLVAVIGLGGLALSRAQSRVVDLQSDIREARSYALSAIEAGRAIISQDANWRSSHSNGNWYSNQPFGNGAFTLNVVNPSGALNRSPSDLVVFTATGAKGVAVQSIQVTLAPALTPYTSLNTALTANSLSFSSATINGTGTTLASLSSVSAGSSSINPNVEYVTTLSGGAYLARAVPVATARTVPDSHVFDYYKANGTAINRAALPIFGGFYILSQLVLSPGSNPFGAADPQGIYVIDLGGASVFIQNCRVAGTLVLLNAGASSTIQGAANFAAVVGNYPCLLVQGSLSISLIGNLQESSGSGTNYNPPGSPYPYPGGTSNTTTSDTYPSAIAGLMYVSGNLSVSGSITQSLQNVIVGGSFTGSSNTVSMSFYNTYYSSPPPGFYTAKLYPVAGSWKQVVN